MAHTLPFAGRAVEPEAGREDDDVDEELEEKEAEAEKGEARAVDFKSYICSAAV